MAHTANKQKKGTTTLYGMAYCLFTALLPLSLCFFVTGDAFKDYALVFWGVMVLWIANVVYGFLQLRDRLLFLFLHFGMALFLLSRPLIAVVKNEPSAWLLSSPETTMFALDSLYLAMACLLGATALCGAIHSHNAEARLSAANAVSRKLLVKNPGEEQMKRRPLPALGEKVAKLQKSEKLRIIRLAALLCYLVCLLGSLYSGSLLLSYMDGRAYTDFYLVDASSYTPWAVSFLESMMPFMLAGYLATLPRRRGAVLCLIAYIASSLPMLMIGSRSGFVINVLFAALYFVFRAVTDKNEVWISRHLVIACCIAAPAGVAAMGFVDYLRAGVSTNMNFLALVEDALYNQGTSFTILGRAYDVMDQIQGLGFRFFSMGGIIDMVMQGFIGQNILGITPLPSHNCYELATQGWSFSHTMSFFAHHNYLGGEGYGSSFILELFADFGYAGIAVGSFILGCGLFLLSHSLGRSWFWGTCALTAASRVFHMPRGYYDEWISYLWSTRFLMAMVLLIGVSAGLYFLKKHVIEAHKDKAPLVARKVRGEKFGITKVDGSAHSLNAYSIAVLDEGCIREVR